MKAGKDLRVPLSDAAVDLLAKVPRIKGADLVFPSSNNKPLGDMTLTAVMRRMGVDAVPRVMRATFKGHGRERTNYPPEVVEIALAHAIANKARLRTDAGTCSPSVGSSWPAVHDEHGGSAVLR